jgi:hypothetical protein
MRLALVVSDNSDCFHEKPSAAMVFFTWNCFLCVLCVSAVNGFSLIDIMYISSAFEARDAACAG